MGLLTKKKSATHPCKKCGRPTTYEKTDVSYDLQLPLMFFTCFFWTPVLIWTSIKYGSAPFVCVECRTEVPSKDVNESDAPAKAS